MHHWKYCNPQIDARTAPMYRLSGATWQKRILDGQRDASGKERLGELLMDERNLLMVHGRKEYYINPDVEMDHIYDFVNGRIPSKDIFGEDHEYGVDREDIFDQDYETFVAICVESEWFFPWVDDIEE